MDRVRGRPMPPLREGQGGGRRIATPASGVVALILAGSVSVAAAQQSASTPPLVLDGATVVDVEQGKFLPTQRVVITGNRIQAMGDTGAVKSPQGAHVVDARGKYLIPGLWDMHFHTWDDVSYTLLVANGVTGIRDAWSMLPIDTQVQWWHEILAGQRVGPPRQLLSGMALRAEQISREDAQRLIDSLKAHGANFIKVYPFSFEYAAAARRAGIPFGGHMVVASAVGAYEDGLIPAEEVPWSDISAMEASDSGMRIFDHTQAANLFGYCFGGAASVENCQPIADRFRRNGSWLVPTLLAEPWKKRYASLVDTFLSARASEFRAGAQLHGNWLRDSVHPGPAHLSAWSPDSYFVLLQRTGMPLLAGTDATGRPGDLWPGFSLHAELATLVAEGVTTALGALQAATLNPAKLLNATDSMGTVAPGKLADLVLLDADPLADITNTTTVRAVVANGRYFDRAALDQLLADVQAKAKKGR